VSEGTVVVTGAGGFIGSHLCDRLLAEGYRVVGIDDLSTGHIANLGEARSYGKEFSFENVDIRADGMSALFERHRPDVVMHLGAQASVGVSLDDPLYDADVNILGTLNLLECAARYGTGKFVFAASGGRSMGSNGGFPSRRRPWGGAIRCRRTAFPRRRPSITSICTSGSGGSIAPPWPWPTSTVLARTLRGRPG
jgi:nucleoside-diphosphate-sugar epimerase